MDDKLKNFLEGKENDPLKNEQPIKKNAPLEEEANKYDKFFADDGDDLLDKVKDGFDKAKDVISEGLKDTTEFLGESLKETGRFFKEGSEGAGKILKEDIIPKAKEAKEKLDVKVDDLTEKLKDYAEKPIEKTPGSGLDESLTDTHSGFFSKMEKLADKLDAQDAKAAEKAAEGILKEGEIKITALPEADTKPKGEDGKIFGFDDLDGDGDELIDDAIIDS